MLQAAGTELFNPLVLKLTIVRVKIHHLLYKLTYSMSVKDDWRIFIFFTSALKGWISKKHKYALEFVLHFLIWQKMFA